MSIQGLTAACEDTQGSAGYGEEEGGGEGEGRGRGREGVRPFFILRIVRPRIFESKFRNHCAKKLVGALRKPTSFM